MPRALVTGIDGFTGRYMAVALKAGGYEVAGLTLQQANGQKGMFACDLLDYKRVAQVVHEVKPDVVVHLAAVSFVAHADKDAFYMINIVGTRNLLRALATADLEPRTVLLASSANIYGDAQIDPITESTPAAPQNDYAVSKYSMELMAGLWQGKLPIVITRPFNYTGAGQSANFLLPKIVDHFRRGAQQIELGNLDVARDFSDVRDVVDQYMRLLACSPSGKTFNVCSGRSASLGEVLDMMASIAGHQIEVTVNPEFVRDKEIKRLRGSNANLASVIGDLNPIPLRETLGWMFETGDASRRTP